LLFLLPLVLLVVAAGIEFVIERGKPYGALVGLVVLEAALLQILAGGYNLPTGTRLIIFTVSSIALIAATAVLLLGSRSWVYAPAAGLLIVALLLVKPVGGAASRAINRTSRDDIRLALGHIKDNWRQDDFVYVYHHVRQSFLYYAPRYGLSPGQYALGTDARPYWSDGANGAYQRELDQYRGRERIWFLFSLVRTVRGVNEEEYFVKELDGRGKRLDEFKQAGVSAYLYDLSSE